MIPAIFTLTLFQTRSREAWRVRLDAPGLRVTTPARPTALDACRMALLAVGEEDGVPPVVHPRSVLPEPEGGAA